MPDCCKDKIILKRHAHWFLKLELVEKWHLLNENYHFPFFNYETCFIVITLLVLLIYVSKEIFLLF